MTPCPAFCAAATVRPAFLGAHTPSQCRHPLPPTPSRPRAAPRVTMAFSSIDGILTASPSALPAATPADLLPAIYTQVLGNAYLMESERAELCTAESQFLRTGDVRAFVRAIALADVYRARFFEPVSQYRFIELAFKHLLARAATSQTEYAEAMATYHDRGYEACIEWFVGSDEYAQAYGDSVVPYAIYKGCYPTNEVFNRSVAMRLAPGCSDKGRPTMLQFAVLAGTSPSWLSIAKSLPPGTEKGTGFTIGGHWQSTQRNKRAPVRVGTKVPGGVVFY